MVRVFVVCWCCCFAFGVAAAVVCDFAGAFVLLLLVVCAGGRAGMCTGLCHGVGGIKHGITLG